MLQLSFTKEIKERKGIRGFMRNTVNMRDETETETPDPTLAPSLAPTESGNNSTTGNLTACARDSDCPNYHYCQTYLLARGVCQKEGEYYLPKGDDADTILKDKNVDQFYPLSKDKGIAECQVDKSVRGPKWFESNRAWISKDVDTKLTANGTYVAVIELGSKTNLSTIFHMRKFALVLKVKGGMGFKSIAMKKLSPDRGYEIEPNHNLVSPNSLSSLMPNLSIKNSDSNYHISYLVVRLPRVMSIEVESIRFQIYELNNEKAVGCVRFIKQMK